MKKNKKIIQEVLIIKKINRNELMIRIYRQMKMIYRDKFIENKGQDLSDFTSQFIEEMFYIYATNNLDIQDLEDVLSMAGIELNDDELRLFAKECLPVLFI